MKRIAVTTEVVKARSWEHAQKLLFRDAWDEGIKRFRSRFVFRGVADSKFRLETSLMRLGGLYAIPRRKIIIPARLKWEIRDKLDHSNINDRMLFPGLSGLCDWLKRFYGPGGSASAKPGVKPLARSRSARRAASP